MSTDWLKLASSWQHINFRLTSLSSSLARWQKAYSAVAYTSGIVDELCDVISKVHSTDPMESDGTLP